jgi:hypothetical protein
VIRTDAEWQSAAGEYVALKRAADAALEQLDGAKQRLVVLANHTSETGGGVTVTPVLEVWSDRLQEGPGAQPLPTSSNIEGRRVRRRE